MAGSCSVSTDFVHSEAAGLCHSEPTHLLATALPEMGNSLQALTGCFRGCSHTESMPYF